MSPGIGEHVPADEVVVAQLQLEEPAQPFIAALRIGEEVADEGVAGEGSCQDARQVFGLAGTSGADLRHTGAA